MTSHSPRPAPPGRPAPGAAPCLPTPPNRLLRRESELSAVSTLLAEPRTRLVTLAGPPGSGKTRLAIEVAQRIGAQFVGNVRFVDLTPVADPALVPAAIVRAGSQRAASGLRARPGRSPGAAVLLPGARNFEHVLPAASGIASLLSACPGLTILVTSRSLLRLSWERCLPVPPLEVPRRETAAAVEDVLAAPAVALFVERARAVNPGFVLTGRNAGAVTDICRRLDGLPLAIELAAARSNALSPQAIRHSVLDEGFPGISNRDAAGRHRTMTQAVEWSFRLLTPDEQRLCRELAVFRGGCTLASAEAVCTRAADGTGLLELLSSLTAKSIVVAEDLADPAPRFRMLETIRGYCLQRLADGGNLEALRRRHAEHFGRLASVSPELPTPSQGEWLRTAVREAGNLHAALGWMTEAGETGLALELANSLASLWWTNGFLRDG